jgi:uncharacterized short protein YbdD (DUF466 family)
LTLRGAARGIAWYLREVAGENDYVRYVAHLRQHDATAAVPSRREFERTKADLREGRPAARCC